METTFRTLLYRWSSNGSGAKKRQLIPRIQTSHSSVGKPFGMVYTDLAFSRETNVPIKVLKNGNRFKMEVNDRSCFREAASC